MQELEAVLRAHAARYPNMEPADAVKLIYQNEFGGGHLIADAESCLARLRAEYEATPRDPDGLPAEEIGNGIIRVNLAALAPHQAEALGHAFIRSARLHRGSLASFRNKLEILRGLCAEAVFSFSPASLDAYLAEYENAGCPMVSHSDAYRSLYRPAYRIVLADEWQKIK